MKVVKLLKSMDFMMNVSENTETPMLGNIALRSLTT
eukprot:CAMPEP_0202940920 /NCGR_PEP_ID=MMETSP1395-20130829/1048_1 /ASSEMBLY_ACC=CAM_ASM_000871 /TAXON_ID=5961 /ORGANISM="Blepharisma japonicum, Strain Stock R1072" /LENGTH=35 /DNA_ID= /DNA_START= /DNA_END= /DNA_ORIENTATION=